MYGLLNWSTVPENVTALSGELHPQRALHVLPTDFFRPWCNIPTVYTKR